MKQILTKAIAGDSFNIRDFSSRPRISSKVREYVVDLVMKKVCEPKNLIINDKFDYELVFSMSKTIPDAVIKDKVLVTERVRSGKKNIHISIYDDLVTEKISPKEYAELLFEGLKIFLTEKYKKITPEEVEAVRQQIDWVYIESLPFPAPFKEQDYILDANPNVEAAYRQQFKE